MGRWWQLARNSGIGSIWFWLFIKTSLSVVILDIDPGTFISISVIIGATIYQNSQRVLSLYLNQCQVVSCQPEPTSKSDVRYHIIISSQYPLQRINVSMLLNWVLFSFILLRFTKFFDEMEAFLLNCYNIFIFYQCWATLLLFWNIKTAWLDMLRDSYKSWAYQSIVSYYNYLCQLSSFKRSWPIHSLLPLDYSYGISRK